MQARATLLARVPAWRAYRRVAGGRRWLDRRWRGPGEDVQPGDVHAEEMALAMMSTTSRRLR
jgi:hypothetical protein